MKALFTFLVALLLSVAAHADITVQNYFPGSTPDTAINQITQYDTSGNQVEFHDGDILQSGSDIYLIGHAWGCGFIYQTVSPYCGVKIYKWTTTGWQFMGEPFDHTLSYWQGRCSGVSTGGGCFDPRMVFNAADNDYVIWLAQGGSRSSGGSTNGYIALTCPTLASTYSQGCTVAGTDPVLTCVGGDDSLFVDDNGDGYVAHASNGTCGTITIEKLDAHYLTGTGSAVGLSGTGGATAAIEGIGMEKVSGVYYLTTSGACGLCNNTPVSYLKSSAGTPLSGWGSVTQLNADSCQGQSYALRKLVGTGPATTLLLSVSQWTNAGQNQGIANNYLQALSFTGSAINTFSCAVTTTIAGFPAGTLTAPPPSGADQTSTPTLAQQLGTTSTFQRMQTFVPTKPKLLNIYVDIGQSCFSNVCGLNGNLSFKLTTVDGSNNPVTTLATVTLTPSQIPWAGTWTPLAFNYSGLTPGTAYGIFPSNASSTGQISFGIYTPATSNPYSAGVERFSTDGGSTWSTETGRAFMFSSFPIVTGGRL